MGKSPEVEAFFFRQQIGKDWGMDEIFIPFIDTEIPNGFCTWKYPQLEKRKHQFFGFPCKFSEGVIRTFGQNLGVELWTILQTTKGFELGEYDFDFDSYCVYGIVC